MLQKTRKLRILLLLTVLFVVAMNSWLSRLRNTDWHSPLWVALYPINGDGTAASSDFIHRLREEDFAVVERFFAEQAERYGLTNDRPVTFKLAPQVKALPPTPPRQGSLLEVVWWSLKLRYWAWRHDTFDGPANAQLYLVFHDPDRQNHLAHSTGLEKGMVGIVNLFADDKMVPQNNVVLAHEFMHLVGASDKYNLSTNQPLFPTGYAEPERRPLYPQAYAELMGGRLPLSEDEAAIPDNLDAVVIGRATAAEINWIATQQAAY
jgi:hypothetical protein